MVQELSAGSVTANVLAGLGHRRARLADDLGGTRTLLTDALGSTVALTDDAGAVQTEYTYEPYGASTETGADDSALQYTGRENDLTGLYSLSRALLPPRSAAVHLRGSRSGSPAGDVNLYVVRRQFAAGLRRSARAGKCLGDRYGRAAAYWYASRQAETGHWYYAAVRASSHRSGCPRVCRQTASSLVAGSASAPAVSGATILAIRSRGACGVQAASLAHVGLGLGSAPRPRRACAKGLEPSSMEPGHGSAPCPGALVALRRRP